MSIREKLQQRKINRDIRTQRGKNPFMNTMIFIVCFYTILNAIAYWFFWR